MHYFSSYLTDYFTVIVIVFAEIVFGCAPPIPSTTFRYNNDYGALPVNRHNEQIPSGGYHSGVMVNGVPIDSDDIRRLFHEEVESLATEPMMQSTYNLITENRQNGVSTVNDANLEQPLLPHLKMNRIETDLSQHSRNGFQHIYAQPASYQQEANTLNSPRDHNQLEPLKSISPDEESDLAQINEVFESLRQSLGTESQSGPLDESQLSQPTKLNQPIQSEPLVDSQPSQQVQSIQSSLSVPPEEFKPSPSNNPKPHQLIQSQMQPPQQMFTPVSDEAHWLTPANGNAHLLASNGVAPAGVSANPIIGIMHAVQNQMKSIRYKNIDGNLMPHKNLLDMSAWQSGENQQIDSIDDRIVLKKDDDKRPQCASLATVEQLIGCLRWATHGRRLLPTADQAIFFKSSPEKTIQFSLASFDAAVDADRDIHVRLEQFAALTRRRPYVTQWPTGKFFAAVFPEQRGDGQAVLSADVVRQNGDGRLSFDYWTTLLNYTLKVCSRLLFEKQCTSDIEPTVDNSTVDVTIVNPLLSRRDATFVLEIIVTTSECDITPGIFIVDNLVYSADYDNSPKISIEKNRKFSFGGANRPTQIVYRADSMNRDQMLRRFKSLRLRYSPKKGREITLTASDTPQNVSIRSKMKLEKSIPERITTNVNQSVTQPDDKMILPVKQKLPVLRSIQRQINALSPRKLDENSKNAINDLKSDEISADYSGAIINSMELRKTARTTEYRRTTEGLIFNRFQAMDDQKLTKIGIQPISRELKRSTKSDYEGTTVPTLNMKSSNRTMTNTTHLKWSWRGRTIQNGAKSLIFDRQNSSLESSFHNNLNNSQSSRQERNLLEERVSNSLFNISKSTHSQSACDLLNCDFLNGMCHYTNRCDNWRNSIVQHHYNSIGRVVNNMKGFAFVSASPLSALKARGEVRRSSAVRKHRTAARAHVLESVPFALEADSAVLNFELYKGVAAELSLEVCLNTLSNCFDETTLVSNRVRAVAVLLPRDTQKVYFVARQRRAFSADWLAISNIHLTGDVKCAAIRH